MNTDKVDLEDKAEVEKAARRVMRVAPSKRRVLEMNDEILLNNYALIAHKASSLSSSQRQLVTARVAYGIKLERFTMDQVADAVNKLTALVEDEIKKEMLENDDSNTK